MDTKPVWDLLSSISIGTVVAWVLVVSAIITAISAWTIKLYKVFTKYRKLKDEDAKQKELLKKHDEVLNQINESLKDIKSALDEQKEVNFKQLRHEIVTTCEEAIRGGEISFESLQSLEEMYGEYTDLFNGNGYVKTLMAKVRRVRVRDRLRDED